MIRGTVNASREAVVRLRLRGPTGVEAEIDAIIDTGFTETLTLPARRSIPWASVGNRAAAQCSRTDRSVISTSTPRRSSGTALGGPCWRRFSGRKSFSVCDC
jgi:predicted aspartyl protease